MRKLETPDVTKNQRIALATAIIGLLATFGVPLSEANENRIFILAIIFPSILMICDAVIRFGRALMAGKKFDDSDLGLEDDVQV